MSNTNTTERIRIITDFQASEAVSEIQRLTLANRNLNAQLEQTDRKTKEGRAARRAITAEIRANTTALNEQYRSLGNAGLNTTQLGNKLNNLRNQYRQLIPAAAGYTQEERRLRAEIQSTSNALNARNAGLRQTQSVFQQFRTQGSSALLGGLAGGIAGISIAAISAIVPMVSKAISAYAKLTDTLADMRKATGLSQDAILELNDELGKIDTRTSKKELQDIIVIAGQMGIANDQILSFTKSTDKLNVALNDEFKGGAEEITKVFGSLRNVLTDVKTKDVGLDMLHLGNAINVLGASGLATGPIVADITNRIGSAGQIYGLTAGQTLGLAAAYQELAISTERGSTATVKVLDKIAKSPAEFAKIAGMGTKEFTKLVNTDISKAFLLVAKGFASSKGMATEFAEKLGDAEISSASISEVLAKVGQNTALVTEKMDLATGALKNTSSIMDEFSVKNENYAAKFDKAGKVWDKWMSKIGNFFAGVAYPVIAAMASLATGSENVTEKYLEQKEEAKNLVGQSTKLLEKYRELEPKLKNNVKYQKEFNEVLNGISKVVPGAVSQWDDYGNAISINVGLLEDFIKKQKQAFENSKNGIKFSAAATINESFREREALQKQLNDYTKGRIIIENFEKNKNKVYTYEERLQIAAYRKGTGDFETIRGRITALNKKIKESGQIIKDVETDVSIVPEPPKKTGDTGTHQTDEQKRKSEQLAEKRKENHAKLIADEAKMDIESIQDSFRKKEAQLIEEYRLFKEEKKKELLAGELSEDDYNQAKLNKRKWLKNQLDLNNQDQEKKTVESALKTAKKTAEVELAEAENSGDKTEILAKKVALSIVDEQLAIATAGEESHSLIQRQFAAARKKIEIDATKETEEEKAKVRKTYEDAREKYEQKLEEDKQKIEEKKAENLRDAKLSFQQKASETLSNLTFSFIKNGIDKELSQEDQKYQSLLEKNDQLLANNEISEEEHAKRKLEIEKQHDAKVRELKRKQAIFDKAKAILDIAINTASGVVRAASGIVTAPMIPFIIATGALEAAAVAASPIPEFATGGFVEPDNGNGSVNGIKKPTPQARLIFAAERGTEFMINNTGVRHPVFPQILPLIQKMNAGENIELGSSSYSGSQANGSNAANNQESILFFKELKGSIDRLNYNLENPIAPNLHIGYKTAEEIVDAANEVKSIISNASAA